MLENSFGIITYFANWPIFDVFFWVTTI